MVDDSSLLPVQYPSINQLFNGGDSTFISWILVWSFKFHYEWLKVHLSIPSYVHPSIIYTMAGRSAFFPWILVWSFKFYYAWLKVHRSIPSYIHPSMIYTMVEGPLSFHGYLYDHSSSTRNGWRFIFASCPISIHQSVIQWWRFHFHSMDTWMIIQVPLWMVEGSSFHPILYPSINDLYNGRDSAFIPWIVVWSFKFYYAWLKVHCSIPS
jgi:hypothetical protein